MLDCTVRGFQMRDKGFSSLKGLTALSGICKGFILSYDQPSPYAPGFTCGAKTEFLTILMLVQLTKVPVGRGCVPGMRQNR